MSSLAREFRAASYLASRSAGEGKERHAFSFNFIETPAADAPSGVDGNKERKKKKKKKVSPAETLPADPNTVGCTGKDLDVEMREIIDAAADMSVDHAASSEKVGAAAASNEKVGADAECVVSRGKSKSGSSKKKKKKLAELKHSARVAAAEKGNTRRPPPGLEGVDPIYGPVVLSHRDPELSEEQKSARRFGNGINLSAIGPRKVLHKGPSRTQHIAASPLGERSVDAASSPFSFGFGFST